MTALSTPAQVPDGGRAAEDPFPLRWSATQVRLLRERAEGAGPAPLVTALELDGPVDATRLDQAWQELQWRHPFLRVRLGPDGPFASPEVRPLLRANIPGSSAGFRTDAAQVLAAAARPRDLATEGPADAAWIRTGPEAGLLICSVDHLATDGWSFGLMARQWGELYRTPGVGTVVDPGSVIARYDEPERVRAHGIAVRNVVEEFEGATPFPLAPSRSGWALLHVDLPLDIAAGLRARATRDRSTPFALALAVLGRALAAEHGVTDAVVSTHVANRSVPQSEQVVCALYNTVPLRISAKSGDDLEGWIASAKQASLRALQRQSLPFATARQVLAGTLPSDAFLRVMINFDQHPFLGLTLPGVEIHESAAWSPQRLGTGLNAPWYSTSDRPWPAGITVSFRETWDCLQLYIHYGAELGDRAALMLLGRVTEGLALLTDSRLEEHGNG